MAPRVAGVLAARGSEHALVVHGADRLDEITTTDVTRVYEVRDGELVGDHELDPTTLGVPRVNREELLGGTPADNVRIMREIFAGEDNGPRSDIVAINAAAGLLVADVVEDFASGLEAARAAIADGRAAAKVDAVVELTQQLA